MKIFLGIMILAFLCGTPSHSNSLEKEFLIKVDGICVQNIDNIKMINIFASTDKWINLPPEQAAMIAPRTKGPSYKAYGFFENEIV